MLLRDFFRQAALGKILLTLSGNEITDRTRVASTAGDGRTPEGSMGVWEASENLITNGGFETDATGWTNSGLTTHARTVAEQKFGGASLECIGDTDGDRTHFSLNLTTGQTYAFSIWIKVTALTAANIFLRVADNGGAGPGVFTDATNGLIASATGVWTRLYVIFTATSTTAHLLQIRQQGAGACTFYVDGAQLENQPIVTPYVETNGAAATRAAARVQVAGAQQLLSERLGWQAWRIRVGWHNANHPGVDAYLGVWGDDASNYCPVYLSTGDNFQVDRVQAGVGGVASLAAGAYTLGQAITVIGLWTPTQVGISADGSAFTMAANVRAPGIIARSFDVGSGGALFATAFSDSDIFWYACGRGMLTDGDARYIHSLGNFCPVPPRLPGLWTGFWDGVSGTFHRRRR